MASNRARGNAWEHKIVDYLTKRGWTCDRAKMAQKCIGPGKWISYSADFFGCFDILAVKPWIKYTIAIQATLGETTSRKKKLEAFPSNTGFKVQLWTRQDGIRSGVRVQTFLDSIKVWDEKIFRMTDEIPPEGVL